MKKFIYVVAIFGLVMPALGHAFVYLEKFPSGCFAGGTFEDALLANLYNCVQDPGGNDSYKNFLDQGVNEAVEAKPRCDVDVKKKLSQLMAPAGGDHSALLVEVGKTLFKQDVFKITVDTYTVQKLPAVGEKAVFQKGNAPEIHHIVICDSTKPDALHDLVKSSLGLNKLTQREKNGFSLKRIVDPPEMMVIYVDKSHGGKITQVEVPLDVGEMVYEYAKADENKYLYELVGVLTDETKGAQSYGFYLKNLRGYSEGATTSKDLLWFKSDGTDLGVLFKEKRTQQEKEKDTVWVKFFAQNGILFFFLRRDKLDARFEFLKKELARQKAERDLRNLANVLYQLAQPDAKKK